jgi:hypothetical protein
MHRRKSYRFSLSEDHHCDIVDFLESLPRALRGAHIVEGLKLHLAKLKGGDGGNEKKPQVNFASMLGGPKIEGGK